MVKPSRNLTKISQEDRVGVIVGQFSPLHMGHIMLMAQAASACDWLFVAIRYRAQAAMWQQTSNMPNITLPMRRRWLSQTIQKLGNHVQLLETPFKDHEFVGCSQDSSGWERQTCIEAIGREPDIIYDADVEDVKNLRAEIADANKRVLAFDQLPVISQHLRTEGPWKHWDVLAPAARPDFVKRVAIVGTESCGKSMLGQKLALVYDTVYVPEVARNLCEELGGCDGYFTREHYPLIAMRQHLAVEDAAKHAKRCLFVDSEAIVTQYYLELYEGVSSPVVNAVANLQNFDLVLFMTPNVPWIDDGLRLHGEPQVRAENSHRLLELMKERSMPLALIDADNHLDRFNQALTAVDRLLGV